MRHIDKIIIKPISESRAASSCGSDIDRQELINNYGNEKYLSKWGIEGQDGDQTAPIEKTADKDDGQRDIQAVDQNQNQLTIEDDTGSLVSYNSVRDGGPAKSTACLPYQVQQPVHDITLWQGYSGNIYFDSVRCRPVHINSSKPIKKKSKKGTTSSRLTKSCSPAMEKHTQAGKNLTSYSASSFHSLGSLRISSREEKKKHTPPRTQSQYSKLRKGFIEKMENRQNINWSFSTPESLVISGGQVNNKNDPLESVYRLNTKIRLSSKNRGKERQQNFPLLIGTPSEEKLEEVNLVNNDGDWSSTRLPRVDQAGGDSEKKSKEISEPTPVFIIPFATLDDPVEPDPKQEKPDKQEKQEKQVIRNENQVEEASPSESPLEQKQVQEESAKPEKLVIPEKPVKPVKLEKPFKFHKSNITMKESEKPLSAHIINITAVSNIPRVSPRYDFQVRREISNSSLSNYLQAVPKTPKSITIPKEQRKSMPKLSYTQRSIELSRDSAIETNDTYDSPSNSLQRTSALYGGYLPSTRSVNGQTFYAELRSETASETSSLSSPQHHVPKSIIKKAGGKGTEREKERLTGNEKCHLPVIGWNLS